MEAKPKRKRILTCYYRPKPGGLCNRLFRAINALLGDGYEVHYLSVVSFPITHDSCHFHRFRWPASKTDTLLFWFVFHVIAPWQLLFVAIRYNVTHAFAFGPTYSLLLKPASLVKRVPISLFLRSDTIENHRIKDQTRWIIAIEKFFEGIAISGVRLYGVSETLASTVAGRHRLFHPVSVSVLRNNVPHVLNGRAETRQLSRPLRLACVGILEARKNQHVLIRCMASIPADYAHLFIYGIGPDGDTLRRLAANFDVVDHVTFRGWIDSPSEVWENIDLLLLPSLHEGMSNSLLEGLAWGVPVLASDVPEHREILPMEDLLDPRRIELWQERLASIALSEDVARELSEMRWRQHPYAKQLCFDWDTAICKAIVSGKCR